METTINNKAAISVQSISLMYNNHEKVICDLSFEVKSNECFCIVGPNGCGKSTILNSLIRQIKPTSGNIALNHNQPIIAYLNQDYRQSNLLWESVIENVSYPLTFQNKTDSERFEIGRKIIEKLHLEIEPKQKVFKLSGGQQQLVSIGRALISNPDILICDEPLSAVDIIHSLNAIKQLELTRKEREFPILWVSHNIDEALLVSDRIGLLSKKTKNFYKIIRNPLSYPRSIENLTSQNIINIKKEIIEFLKKETNI